MGSAGAASTVAGPQGIQGVQGPVGPAGAAGGGSLSPVSTVYTASGAIALTDTFAAINSTTATSMTLANGTTDGANLTIKRIGSGTVKLAATIDGAAQFALFTSAGTLRESVNLSWSASLATWLLKASAVAFTSSTSNPPSAQYWRIRILAASGGDGYTQLGRLFFSGADGVNLATGIAWAETSTYSGGNLSPGGPGWISGQGGVYPQNVRYNFGSPVAIYTVALTSGPDAVFNRSPTSFVIEYSSDDVTYTPRNTCTPAAWTAQGQVQTFAVS